MDRRARFGGSADETGWVVQAGMREGNVPGIFLERLAQTLSLVGRMKQNKEQIPLHSGKTEHLCLQKDKGVIFLDELGG